MIRQKLYLICYDNAYKKRGKVADIISIVKLNNAVICYQIMFDDFDIDFIEIDKMEQNNWHLVTLDDLLKVGMPL